MTTLIDRIPDISSEEIERVRRPLNDAYTLPPRAYLSEEIFALEETQIMRKSWIPLARVDQIGEPGQYMSLDLLGQPVMVVHGTDGEFRVMSRVCLHRAAPIAEGNGKRKLFTCPYHAWSYDTTGQLIRAPLMDGADGSPRRTASFRKSKLKFGTDLSWPISTQKQSPSRRKSRTILTILRTSNSTTWS